MFRLFVTYIAEDAQKRQAFFDEVAAAGIIEATRAEDGCMLYDYFFSAEREGEILLVENWVDKEAQEIHDKLPHLEKLGEIKARYGIKTEIKEF